ncbi:NAD-dependent epimerase/dehydratase family protein [Parafilimonas terrae]|uniref:NAD dependent epimerase/dehydratase family protein n=1 Tax=Parafilimonas terrae TaxID=1465490 RepID=A0A1I5UEQ9_9BACT|nr:NAD-dependent epimerase/dehydratase family protein [Parafilimonas terrae]SFP93753.1 NAD dependent epimerase/dehydratase family protein [Parafilimonas terrae]
MIVGNGMLANRFSNYKYDKGKIIFASGVSNSGNLKEENFQRELKLLNETIDTNPGKQIVYFSTCSIYDDDLKSSPYVLHKISAENLIKRKAEKFLICRISNIAGISNNPYTLLNYFIFNILQHHPFTIWKNAYRNIIGIDDVFTIANDILQNALYINNIVNIANPFNYSVSFIVKTIEEHLSKEAVYTEIDRGVNYNIDISAIRLVIDRCNIQFPDNYLSLLLKKYYHSK